MKKILSNFQGGQTLIELLITIGLAAILMPAFLTSFFTTRSGRAQQDQRLQAIAYVREAEEAVRIVRDNNWSNLTTGNFYPSMSGSSWTLVSTTSGETVGSSFTRLITIADAYRDATTHQIVVSGGVADPSTKAVTITVSWTSPISSQVQQMIYITRHDNLSYLDTSTTDFNAGTNNGTTVTNIYGGEVQIGGGGSSDWCAPNAAGIISSGLSGNGKEVAIMAFSSTATNTPSYAYTTFGFNASGDSLDKWNVSNPPQPSPPVVSSGASPQYNQAGEKTYGIYATSSAVLAASNKNGVSVDIINPNASPISRTATFQDGSLAGYSVYGGYTNSGFYGFATVCTLSGGANSICSSNNKLDSFPMTGAGSPTGSASLAAQGNKIVVVRGLAFVATASTSKQLQVFNITNPASISEITLTYTSGDIQSKQGGAGSAKGATSIAVDNTGTYAYIVTSYVDSSHPDIFKINVSGITTSSSTANIAIEATANTIQSGVSMSPTGVIIVSQNHLVVVGSGGRQYQVFYSTSLNYCSTNFGPLTGVTNVKDVASVSESDGDNFAYILTDNSSSALEIIPGGEGAGGGGGGTGAGNGTFTSQPIPVPSLAVAATFNSFSPVADTPSPTSIKFQVAVAPAVGGSCSAASYTFIGPNGTTSNTDTFATSSAIPLSAAGGVTGYSNPAQCFKYKAILDSGGSTTASPILYEVRVNYSP